MVKENHTEHKEVMIHVVDLWKSFGGHEVLKGLSLDIYEGETLVILGRSGGGKSVLMKHIIGLEQPDKGYIEIKGERITDTPTRQSPYKIGMLFQGAALFDSMNVHENTSFYLKQHEENLNEKEVHERVEHSLEMVGLKDVGKKMPSELSGGMRKRAALARLIVYRPSILLYDEPTAGLDPITAMHINELINKTQTELNATSVVVTHDIRSALEVGDRLAFHYEGKIGHVSSKEKFFEIDDPIIQSFYKDASFQLR